MASINWVPINTQVCAELWDMMESKMNKEGDSPVEFVSLPQSLGAVFLQVWLASGLCQTPGKNGDSEALPHPFPEDFQERA